MIIKAQYRRTCRRLFGCRTSIGSSQGESGRLPNCARCVAAGVRVKAMTRHENDETDTCTHLLGTRATISTSVRYAINDGYALPARVRERISSIRFAFTEKGGTTSIPDAVRTAEHNPSLPFRVRRRCLRRVERTRTFFGRLCAHVDRKKTSAAVVTSPPQGRSVTLSNRAFKICLFGVWPTQNSWF
jgi:hypothetical protein